MGIIVTYRVYATYKSKPLPIEEAKKVAAILKDVPWLRVWVEKEKG